jgi:hypothetical protein
MDSPIKVKTYYKMMTCSQGIKAAVVGYLPYKIRCRAFPGELAGYVDTFGT